MDPAVANHPPMTVWDDDAQDPFEWGTAGRASSAGGDVAAKVTARDSQFGSLRPPDTRQ